ncbi:type IV secretion system DNA-binding domain-containing protein, partial [Patescibacteria group bacterium]|nr:type IV secretion system DNA-binding domain-containing protein [Patescibacteria group bacterium]
MLEELFTNNLELLIGVLFGFVSIAAVCIVLIFVLRKYIRAKKILNGGNFKHITLMVTVPKYETAEDVGGNERTAEVQEDISIAETFYSAFGGLKAQKGIKHWFAGRTDEIALEMVASEKLITFYITVPQFMHEFLEQQLHAQYSNANIEPVEDYNIFQPNGTILGGYMIFKRENVLPIKTYKEMDSDPISAITNTMSKVQEEDGIAIQIIARSAKSSWRSLGQSIVQNMHKGMEYNDARRGKKNGASEWFDILKGPKKDAVGQQIPQQRTVTQAEQKMLERLENKITKAGMDVNIRIISSSPTADSAKANLNQVMQAFAQYNIYEYGNAFTESIPKSKTRLVEDFIYRRFDEKYGLVLNTEEMASLWHLPLASTETPNIRWMEARIAPAPAGIPSEGLHLGSNQYRGKKTDIYIKDGDRRRHMYLVGKTGSGKSWFLRHMAVQDIRDGKGVAVIDPHGDLVNDIMGSIPKERIDDVVYFNPADTERPMGLNMLESPSENMRDFVVQEMISIFYMLFPPEMIGPMFEHNMRNYMLTLMADLDNPGTIVEIPRMISDEAFQALWVSRVKDPVVRSFWEDEMAKTSDYHKSEMMGYLVSKVGRFVENEMMRNIIGQSKSAFDFREIMDNKKILLVNLSKGQTGEVNGNLIGLIIVAKLQMAAFSRADIPEDQRKDFYLYIDEFQNFITPSIATILSEARKYKLNLVLAHQYMGQLVKDNKTEIRDAILGNVGNMMVSRIGPEDVD